MDSDNINPRILLLILLLAIIFQISLWLNFQADDKLDIIDMTYLLGLISCFTASFVASKKFGNSKIFGKGYLILGIAFVSYFIGELIYLILDLLGESPYPAIEADYFILCFILW